MKCENCGKKEGVLGKFRTKDGVFKREMCLCEDCERQFEDVSLKAKIKRHRLLIAFFIFVLAVIGIILLSKWWQNIHEPLKWL